MLLPMKVLTLSPALILDIYRAHGHRSYSGEPVSHLLHAWQCGQLAYFADASPALQLACWLHDLGHLVSGLQGTPTLRGENDQHELLGADLLEPLWGPDVAGPIRLHVLAKRYLVTRHPHYRDRLSADSLRSLQLQGGDLSAQESLNFESCPHHKAALLLRVWDEQAKQPDWFAHNSGEALNQLGELMASVQLLGRSQ
jgi:predicted HD phosphohydrolase